MAMSDSQRFSWKHCLNKYELYINYKLMHSFLCNLSCMYTIQACTRTCTLYTIQACTRTCTLNIIQACTRTCTMYIIQACTCTCTLYIIQACTRTCSLYIIQACTLTCTLYIIQACTRTCTLYIIQACTRTGWADSTRVYLQWCQRDSQHSIHWSQTIYKTQGIQLMQSGNGI